MIFDVKYKIKNRPASAGLILIRKSCPNKLVLID